MSEYAGRIISATEPTVTSETASGVWTLEEAAKYKQADTWPTVVEADPNFNQTVLLLHGDGTNGAQNNTFLDGSTNNFTITRNGNTTQGTFSPFSGPNGYWSNYLDGNDWVQVADNSALELGSGDFTIEAWVYFTPASLGGANTGIAIVSKWNASNYSYLASFFNDGGTWKLNFSYSTNGSSATNVRVTAGLAANVWYHVAYVRSGSSLKMFLDGVEKTTTETISGTLFDGNEPVAIGRTGDGFNYATGYFSNVRIVKGTAVYTSSFTPPTAPLTAISGTSLLTCQSNRFVDNSTNAFAITRNGDVRVTPFSPFAPSAAYSASTNGGSGYFDGSGDYLSIADNAAFTLGASDFTVEAWIYWTGSGLQTISGTHNSSGVTGSYLLRVNSGQISGAVFQSFTDYTATSSAGSIQTNCWNHVAFVRDGSTLRVYINGVQDGTRSVAGVTVTDSPDILGIGRPGAFNGQYFQGFISCFRQIVGTCLYPSGTSFTPPNAPPTAVTNTVLLCNFTNAGILDNTGKNNLETVGNAQIDTTTKKFGTGSMEFDGTGDYLITQSIPYLALRTAPFTLEFWAYPLTTSDNDGVFTFGGTSSGLAVTLFSNTWNITTSGSGGTSMGSASPNAWIHIAVVRETTGGVLKFYKNGVYEGQVANADLTDSQLKIGYYYDSSYAYHGYLDDFRITLGVARYTAAFTPPTKAFEDK